MSNADSELIAEFVVESQEGLVNIERQLLAIEAGGVDVDVEIVNAVFRTMHTIKGTAGFLGLDRIGALAHSLEEVLNGMRNREISTSSELVTTILHAADYMKQMIDASETSNDVDISVHAAQLHKFRPGAEPSAEHDRPVCPPVSPTRLDSSSSMPAAAAMNSDAVREFIVECCENLDQMDLSLLQLEKEPASDKLIRVIFRTMHTIKGGAGFLGLGRLEKLAHAAESLLGRLRDGTLSISSPIVESLLATVDGCREGLRLLELGRDDDQFDPEPIVRRLEAAGRGEASSSKAGATAVSPSPAAVVDGPVAAEIDSVEKPEAAVAAAKSQSETRSGGNGSAPEGNIRVDVGLLDKLMTRVGELVLARNQIVQYTSRLEDPGFISTAQRLNLITTELQESVMKTRMQPIGNVWAKFPRVVRDLASQLGKQVRIEMEGRETELDKTIVEAIKDPLTHLVRNSVDHGIESPAARRAAGKPEEGLLLLRAYHEGGQVNIEIIDDGAGLNLERIRQKGVERGLVSTEQAARLSDRDVAQLIFAPGFSTAEKVTSVSGRGVGMDVVKTNIEKISGTIDLQTKLGHGTTIKIKIPLTLAIIPALVVTNDGDRYAIPQVSLLELVRLDGEAASQGIEYFHGAPVYRLRGKLLPLVHLSNRLAITDRSTPDATGSDRVVNIVVLRANDHQFGLVVDKVNDTEEIVVKPLSRQLKGLPEYAGATIMGDGTVALILDVMGLAVAAGLATDLRESNRAAAAQNDGRAGRRMETLLVVDLGDARRFALPTSMISRLEKVSAAEIEYAEGREVIQYRSAIMPLIRLHEVFGSRSSSDVVEQELQIVVYAEDDRRYGFVVNRIIDIVEIELSFAAQNDSGGNLLGTAVIQQHVTDVLNLHRLARHVGTPCFAIR